MDFVSVDSPTSTIDIGGQFYADLTPATATEFEGIPMPQNHTESMKEDAAEVGGSSESNSTENDVVEVGGSSEQDEIDDFLLDDYKIVGELRPQDCFVLQKLRGGVIVPTWETPGMSGRQMGKILQISGDTTAEYTENLERAGDYSFPEGAKNKALEVIY